MPPAERPDDDLARAGPAARAGMSVAEYDWRVRDMAKNLVHPAALYAIAQVAGLTKLLPHPVFAAEGGGWREAAAFACSFLGAWAVLLSTLLRDAGLRSQTVTWLVPLAVVSALAVWLVLPGVDALGAGSAAAAAAVLVVPGPVAWGLTVRRWRSERRRVAALLQPGAGA